MLNLKVDIGKVKNKNELIVTVAKAFGINDLSGNSWDAFEDDFRSLDTESQVYKDAGNPKEVNLQILGMEDAKKSVEPNDIRIFTDILDRATEDDRYDGVNFTYETV